MSIKLFSFLGTGCYVKCNYELMGIREENKCFIQEALINILSKKVDLKEIYIFKTQEATVSNWIRNKKYDKEPGLRDILLKYKDRYKISPVDIPSGKSEDELWQIFDSIFNKIDKNDEIIFDITHSFRSLPMIALIILNYAKFVKKCKINGIFYGAFEALGTPREIEYMPTDLRNVPIFDLTPFVKLLDWTVGIDRFIETGDARSLNTLMKSGFGDLWKNGKRDDKLILEKLTKNLENFTLDSSTCRGKSIDGNGRILKQTLDESLNITEQSYIKPIKPLIEILKEQFNNYTTNEYKNMLEVVKWCSDHNQIQQGLTILEEGIISYLCDTFKLDKNDINCRNFIGRLSHILGKNGAQEELNELGIEHKDIIKMILSDADYKNLLLLISNIQPIRNDINHAGWRNDPSPAKSFGQILKNFLNKANMYIKVSQI